MRDFTSAMKMFMVMGELTDSERTLKEKVAYEERIVFATMRAQIPEWQKPKDWDELTDEEKNERLEKLKKFV